MATSSVSSTTSTTSAADLAAANKANAQKIMTSLGAGSGVDVTSLAQSLVNAEGIPKQNAINAKITKNDNKVSGLSAVMFMMSELKTKLSALKDRNSFNTVSATNTNTSALNVTASNTASVGTHQITVNALSQSQRTISTGFASAATSLNGGNPFALTIENGNTAGVSVGTPWSSTINSAAINDPTFGTAASVNDFKNFSIDVDGKVFSITPAPATATLNDLAANLQAQLRAQDGSDDLSVTVSSGKNIEITSATSSRVLSSPSLSKSTTINLSTGASGGTTSGTTITDVNFGTTPTVSDFSAFSITIDGKSRSIIPAPNEPTLDALASNIQSQLRILDGSDDMSVTVTGSTLSFSSASSLALTNIALTEKTYDDTPAGLVAAINSANRGYKAQLINDGGTSPYKVMITGDAAGSTESFSLSSTSTSALGFTDVTSASDASLTVNGVSYTRQTNTISDIVTGVTLDLKATSTTAASVMVSRDTSVIQTKLDELVVAYNDFNNILTETANPDSTLDTYGGTLVGNNTLRIVRQQMRNILLGASSTGSGAMTSLGQLGLSLDQKGVMSLDATKVTSALQNNFDEVTKMFTGGYNNLSTYSTLPAGIAGDAVRKLSNLLSSTGPLVTQTENANTQNDKYRETLAKLQVRLDAILARYTKQFAAMDSLVGSVNTQKTSLKSTFEGMMASYTDN